MKVTAATAPTAAQSRPRNAPRRYHARRPRAAGNMTGAGLLSVAGAAAAAAKTSHFQPRSSKFIASSTASRQNDAASRSLTLMIHATAST